MVIFNAPANHRNSGIVAKLSTGAININLATNDTWGSHTKIGTVLVSTVSIAELKVGTSALNGRHTIFVTNDTSKLFYIKNTSTLNSSDGILVNSGVGATIKLNPSKVQHVYALAFTGSAFVKVMEMKNST